MKNISCKLFQKIIVILEKKKNESKKLDIVQEKDEK